MLCASPGVPVCLKEKHNARKAVWFTKATVIGVISAFVDSIDSHIILRMIRESIKKSLLQNTIRKYVSHTSLKIADDKMRNSVEDPHRIIMKYY